MPGKLSMHICLDRFFDLILMIKHCLDHVVVSNKLKTIRLDLNSVMQPFGIIECTSWAQDVN